MNMALISRDKNASKMDLFSLLNPERQLEFFHLMDWKEFCEFVSENKDNLFDCILDGVFEGIICGNMGKAVKFFEEMTNETRNKFVNKIENPHCIMNLFNNLYFGGQIQLIKSLMPDKFDDFLIECIDNGYNCSYFCKFLECFEEDSADEKEIYAKFSQLTPETIVRVLDCLEKSDEYVGCKILQRLDNQKIFDICQSLDDYKLCELLIKCDFSIILNGDTALTTLICKKTSKGLIQDILDILIKRGIDLNQLFDEEGIAYLYMAGAFEEKQYLLKNILIDKDIKQLRVIYETCSEHDKIKLLEMMMEKPQAYEYTVETQSVLREKAMKLLEEKGNEREFFEEIFLRYFKAKTQ